MSSLYTGTTESILTSCIAVRYEGCTASCRKTLHRIVRAAEPIVATSLATHQDTHSARLTRKALCTAGDASQPASHCIAYSVCCLQGGDCRVCRPGPADLIIHQAVKELDINFLFVLTCIFIQNVYYSTLGP